MSVEKLLLMRSLFFWGGFIFFLALELFIPYRPDTVSKVRRLITNLSLTLFNSVILNFVFAAFTVKTASYVTGRHAGLLNLYPLPSWARILITVAFMDLMLYVWHFLNHEMPFFWRFHRVHHSDMNMDVSTATRFHTGELAISAVIKAGLIFFLGADITGVVIFESLLVLAAQFHHSSLRVPERFERVFLILFVPPSMHRIHHSVVIRERDTNYGTIFSLWDRLLETFLKGIDQSNIVIGLGPYRNPEELKFRHLLVMPFTRQVK